MDDGARVSRVTLLFVSEPRLLEITIRPALLKDAEQIAHVYLESARFHATLDSERYAVPLLETILARYQDRARSSATGGSSTTLVAQIDGEIAGFIDVGLEKSHDLMHRELTYSHVAEIAVSERYRDKGIGGLLLQEAEDWGRGKGAEFASLEFHRENKRAGLFYQKRGYGPVSTTAIKRL